LRRLLRKGVQIIEAVRPIGSATGTVAVEMKDPQILATPPEIRGGAALIGVPAVALALQALHARSEVVQRGQNFG
jgi:hypothetical protein